jgi:Zn-dependent oligopeptidase
VDSRKRVQDIISTQKKDLSVLKNLNELERVFGNAACYIGLLKSVHPDKEIRDKCNESITELDKFSIEIK